MIADLADDRGRFSILAIDHRDSLRQFLRPEDPDSLTVEEITALKIEIVDHVGDLATGVMLEPEYSIPQVLDAGVMPPAVGFLAALESQGYLDDPEAAATTVLDGWSVEQAKASGAASAKLLLPYRPDGRLAAEQEAVAQALTAECHAIDFPIALEPLFYGLTEGDDRGAIVVETARRFASMSPDLLKLPYPGDRGACEEVTEICAEHATAERPMPWAMLSGGGSSTISLRSSRSPPTPAVPASWSAVPCGVRRSRRRRPNTAGCSTSRSVPASSGWSRCIRDAASNRRSAGAACGDDLGDDVVGPAVRELRRQVREGKDRGAFFADLHEAEVLASRFADAVRRLETQRLDFEVGVHALELVELGLAAIDVDRLVLPRADRQHEHGERDRCDDAQCEDAGERSDARTARDPLVHGDRSAQVAQS